MKLTCRKCKYSMPWSPGWAYPQGEQCQGKPKQPRKDEKHRHDWIIKEEK